MPARQQRNENDKGSADGASATASSEPAPTPQRKTSHGSGLPWGGLVVAFLSLGLGILTPPLLNIVAPNKDATVSSLFGRLLQQQQQQQQETDKAPTGAAIVQNLCTEERLKEFWHVSAVRGLHIVCFDSTPQQLEVTFYANSVKDNEETVTLPLSTANWSELKETFTSRLKLTPWVGKKQQWAVFSAEGERLVSENDKETTSGEIIGSLIRDHGMVLLFEGGQFLWPGVRIGFERTVDLYSIMPEGSPHFEGRNKTVTLETLSITPLVLSVSRFLTEAECSHVQEVAAPHMVYSGVVLKDNDSGRPASDFRTSQTTFVQANDDILVDIDYRTASLVRVPRIHQEHTQVLRYGVTEKYVSHHDYFDPQDYQNDANTLQLIRNGERNRMSTVFWYLTTVEAGGETIFPRFNGGVERSPSDCETGLKVKPEAGKVIIFYSMHPDGSPDPASLHGACPVKEGVKWAANKVGSLDAVSLFLCLHPLYVIASVEAAAHPFLSLCCFCPVGMERTDDVYECMSRCIWYGRSIKVQVQIVRRIESSWTVVNAWWRGCCV